MSKVILFVRVSTSKQDVASQLSKLEAEAIRLGYPISNHVVIQHTESAISLDETERLGIEELKDRINSDPDIDCLIIWEISRIARRADVIYKVRDFLLSHKVRWICVEPYIEVIDSDGKQTQMASIMLALFTSFAESEMQIKKERAKRGIEYKKSLNKHYSGRILTGYAVDSQNNRYPDPYWSKFILKIFKMYATGKYSIRALGKELHEQGFYKNIRWQSIPHIISEQLKDNRYTGRVPGWPLIVPVSLFNRCQEVAKAHNLVQKTVNTSEMLCKGIVFSEESGYAMNPLPSKGQYMTHPDYGKCVSILSRHLDSLVIEFTEKMVKAHLMNPKQRKQDLQNQEQLVIRKIATATIQKDKVQEKINRVEERYINGNISVEKADAMSAELKKELQRWIEQLQTYNDEKEKVHKSYTTITDIDFSSMSFEEKRKWVLEVVNGIYVRRDKPLARVVHVRIDCAVDGKDYFFDVHTQNKKKNS